MRGLMNGVPGPMRELASNYYRSTIDESASGFGTLKGDPETRVCVVGGGFAGLNTAWGLAERGMRDVVLLESERVAHGASGRNGGFVFGGFSRGPERLAADLGPEAARALYRGTIDAVRLIRTRCRTLSIDCDLVDEGVYWANWFRRPNPMLRFRTMLAEGFGQTWEWVDTKSFRGIAKSDRYHGALFEREAMHFHPLKYALGLARACTEQGIGVFERSPVTEIRPQGKGWQVRAGEHTVRCEHVVLACGGYLSGLRARVDASVLPIATYVVVTKPLGARMQDVLTTRSAVYDSRFAFDYYRPLLDTRMLWGGRISIFDRDAGDVERLLRRDLLRVYPQLHSVEVDFAWSGLMSYARHEMPQLLNPEPGLWVAQAFGGHGVAPTTLAGEVLAARLLGDDPLWQSFQRYGLVSAFKPAGLWAAQCNYWWFQARDWLRERMDRFG